MRTIRVLTLLMSSSLMGVVWLAAMAGLACSTGQPATPAVQRGDAVAGSAGMDQGITDDEVLFGQSAVFSGPSQDLGRSMRLGIETAFREANAAGGVHGRELNLKTLDDSYETDYAFHTTKWLIEKAGVFALIGAVGTPTSRISAPLARDAGVPFLAPLTGAEFLRDPALDNVLNLRASYYQETEELVARFTEDLGITRIGVLYQDDSFGTNGLEGVRLALERRGLEPMASWTYERNAGGARRAALDIVAAEPEAVIMIAVPDVVAEAVELVRHDMDPVIGTVSFGGGNGLVKALGSRGSGVYVTQVVPFPGDVGIPAVAGYRAALTRYAPDAEPGFVSLEGYLAGRVAIAGLESCGRHLGRQCFMEALRTSGSIDIDGFRLQFGLADNQGSDAVFLTEIDDDGKYREVDRLSAQR